MLTPPLPTLTRDAGARHPVPIAFPDLQAVAARSRQRADEDNRAWQLQRERMDTLIRARAGAGDAAMTRPDERSAEPDEPRPPLRAGDLLRVIALVLLSWAAVAAVLLALGVRP